MFLATGPKYAFVKASVAAGLIALSTAGFAMISSAQAAGMSAIDKDGDGTLTMQEAHDAAEKKFDALDTEHTGKLTEKQVSAASKAMTEMARHDKDHTIDKTEYMAGVDAAFKEADPNGKGSLDAAALQTPAGKRFLELVE